MKKSIFSLLAVLFLSVPLSAQYFGLRAGVINTDATINFSNVEVESDGESNLMLGFFADLPVVGDVLSFQPELNYLDRGFSYRLTAGGNEFSQSLTYFDFTGLAKLNFGRDEGLGFYLGAGPTFSYAVSGRRTDITGETDIDFSADRVNRNELSFTGVAGITLDLGLKLFAEARYVGAVTDLSDDDNSEIRQRYIGINGGILFPF